MRFITDNFRTIVIAFIIIWAISLAKELIPYYVRKVTVRDKVSTFGYGIMVLVESLVAKFPDTKSHVDWAGGRIATIHSATAKDEEFLIFFRAACLLCIARLNFNGQPQRSLIEIGDHLHTMGIKAAQSNVAARQLANRAIKICGDGYLHNDAPVAALMAEGSYTEAEVLAALLIVEGEMRRLYSNAIQPKSPWH